MTVSTIDQGPSLFDPKPRAESAQTPVAATQAERIAEPTKSTEPSEPAETKQSATAAAEAHTDVTDVEAADAVESGESAEASSDADDDPNVEKSDEPPQQLDRKRLAEQLDALRRKEAELLRALAITDHPDLADAIRTIEAKVYCVSRADAKLAQGLSKGEARRQETINKKLSALREKRAELDVQIEALEAENNELGAARLADFQKERTEALESLMMALATHDPAISAAGLEVQLLLPELGGLMPDLENIAKAVSQPRA